MKQQSFTTQSALSMYLRVRKLKMVFILFLSLFSFQALYAEEACEIEKTHGQGFLLPFLPSSKMKMEVILFRFWFQMMVARDLIANRCRIIR
jgi:hypothetical protein